MPNSHIPVITIDGPTASGKGTVAARVAAMAAHGWSLAAPTPSVVRSSVSS